LDYGKLQKVAQKLIKSSGVAVQLVVATPATYNVENDTYNSTLATYDVKGVMINPTMQNEVGMFSKSENVRWLLSSMDINGAALPTLAKVDFKIVFESEEYHPTKTVPIRPGGTILVYLIDVK
jgi:hypothetical protein